jgi:predicted RNase H-like nuclease
MTYVVGVDGCRGGWVVIGKDLATDELTTQVCARARELSALTPVPEIIAIDIPIGLPTHGARACDRAARQLLGPRRASSVFAAPARPMLAARDYAEACRLGLQINGRKLSRQTFNLFHKIREVDAWVHDRPSTRIREVHPEVCFYFLNGERPLTSSKKTPDGQAARRDLLHAHFGSAVDAVLARRRELRVQADDLLDALAALWTAERIARGQALTLPAEPPCDEHGLRMEIVA